jgi:hypothetical protein
LFSLDVIFGLPWPSVVNLPANPDAFVVNLPAGFSFCWHLLDPLLEKALDLGSIEASPLGAERIRFPRPSRGLLPEQPHPKDRR